MIHDLCLIVLSIIGNLEASSVGESVPWLVPLHA